MHCIARTVPWQDVLYFRLSVRLSHAGINDYTYPQSFFSTILVFPYQTGWQYSDGDPDNGGVELKGVWKNHDFRLISHFISHMMQDKAIVTMEGE